MRRFHGWPVVAACLIVLLGLQVLSIRKKSPTYDEPLHLRYGQNILHGRSDRIGDDDSKMPITALNALPGLLLDSKNELGRIRIGRYVTMLFTVGLAALVFAWTRALYGFSAGALVLAFFAFSPSHIAHGRLVTTDVYAGFATTLALFAYWRFLKSPSTGRGLACGLALGLAQIAKYSCIFLYPVFVLIALVRFRGRVSIVPAVRWTVILVLASLVVINCAYLFNGSLAALDDYAFESRRFQSLQQAVGPLRHLPVPLPVPYLEGLDRVSFRDETGYGFAPVYLLGEMGRAGEEFRGFGTYYLVALLYKVPLAVWLLFLLSAWEYVRRRHEARFSDDEVFLLVPLLFYFLYFSFALRAQLGIRLFLVVMPLLWIFCGSLLRNRTFSGLGRARKGVVIALFLYLAVSVLSYFPHYIPYFNEILWNRKKAYTVLADSNIDWGQDYWYVEEYRRSHAREGTLIIGVNRLLGVNPPSPETYRWLRDRFEPVGHVGYTHLIYEIAPAGRQQDDPDPTVAAPSVPTHTQTAFRPEFFAR